MSGLEIFGAVAAASQLVEAGSGIVSLISLLRAQVHDAPASFEKRLGQVQHLISIARLIESSPALQTDLIRALLESCRREATQIEALLRELTASIDDGKLKRYWKAVGDVKKEKRLSAICERLEECKSAIVLCIVSQETTETAVMRNEVQKVVQQLPSIRETAVGVSTLLKELDGLRSSNLTLQADLAAVAEEVAMINNHRVSDITSRPSSVTLVDQNQQYDLQESVSALQEAAQKLTVREPGMTETKQRQAEECIDGLPAIDQISYKGHLVNLDGPVCRWLFKHPTFESWTSSQRGEMLYVTAPAGCGKTTLTAYVLDHLRQQHGIYTKKEYGEPERTLKSNLPPILHFFFTKSDRAKAGCAKSAIGTLISQLVRLRPKLLPLLLHVHDSNRIKNNVSWTFDLLWTTFLELLGATTDSCQYYIIIDALDECEGAVSVDLVQKLRSLLGGSTQSTANKIVPKIFITGRRREEILDLLSSSEHFEVTTEHTRSDLTLLISQSARQLADRRSLDQETEQQILRFMNIHAEGMFLWVVLVMKELSLRNKPLTEDVLRSKLHSVPTTLASTYATILDDTPELRREELWRTLRWLLYCKGSMELSQLQGLLCQELAYSNWYDFQGDLEYICRSIIRIEENTVRLVHQTARDYLKDYVARADIEQTHGVAMEPTKAHASLAMVCIEALLKDQILQSLGFHSLYGGQMSITTTLEKHPAFSYAAENWAKHLQTVVEPDPDLFARTVTLMETQAGRDALIRLDYFFRYAGKKGYPIGPSRLHIACYFNIPWLVAHCIAQDDDRNPVADADDTPLVWASEMGSYECAQLLLEAGADPNKVEFDGWSALHWIAANGHTEMCGLLLRHGANPHAKDGSEVEPIDWAVEYGHDGIANLLFEAAGSPTDYRMDSGEGSPTHRKRRHKWISM